MAVVCLLGLCVLASYLGFVMVLAKLIFCSESTQLGRTIGAPQPIWQTLMFKYWKRARSRWSECKQVNLNNITSKNSGRTEDVASKMDLLY
jgi:hypothetical protein